MIKIIPLLTLILFINSCIIGDDQKLGGLADDDSVIAHYPLDGNAGDISGNGHDGIMYGDPTAEDGRDRNAGTSLGFDGINDYIKIPDEQNFNLSEKEFTISLWVNIASLGSSSDIFTYYYSSTVYFSLAVSAIWGNLNISINGNTFAPVILDINRWYHIITVCGTSGTTLYIDGEKIIEHTHGIGSFSGTVTTFIGSANGGLYFNGRIDNLTILGRALSANEAKILYRNSSGK